MESVGYMCILIHFSVCVWYVCNNNKEKEAMSLRERWGTWQMLKGGCMEGFGSRKELGNEVIIFN